MYNSQPISIDTPPQTDTINLDTGEQGAIPVAPQTADQRATKAQFAVGSITGHSYDDLYNGILTGQEPAIRAQAAAAVDQQNVERRNRVILDVANKRQQGEPLKPEDVDTVNKALQVNKPTDPNTVFEEQFSKQYLGKLYGDGLDQTSGSWMDSVVQQYPDQTRKIIGRADEYGTKMQMVNTELENTQDTYASQPMIPWMEDFGKSMVPGYWQSKLRGIVAGTGILTGGLTGENLEEQSKQLFRLPLEQFKVVFPAYMQKLKEDNPSAALAFVQAMHGMSTQDVVINDAMDIADITGVPGLVKAGISLVGRGLGAAGKAAGASAARQASRTASEDAAFAAAKDVTPEAAAAAHDVAEASAGMLKKLKGPITPAKIEEAAGNIGEAAVQQESKRLAITFKGLAEHTDALSQPTIDAIESLPTAMRADADEIPAGSRLHTDTVNQIQEAQGKFADTVMDALMTMQRVERLGTTLDLPTVITALKDDVVQSMPGLRNSIMDVSAVYREPISNTHFRDVYIGKPGKELWGNLQQARTYAESMGIQGAVVQGPQGRGWFIKVPMPVKENEDFIRDNLIVAPNAQNPITNLTKFNYVLDRVRTADDTLSVDHRQNRKTATYTPQRLREIMGTETKKIEDLKRLRDFFLRDPTVDTYSDKPAGFTTAKGSTYAIQPDGTTIRNKAARPEHPGDSGIKPKSHKTVYLEPKDANALAPPRGNWRILDHGNGTLSTATPNPKSGYGIAPTQRDIPYSTTPKIGHVPLELFTPTTVKGTPAYRNLHFGNPIVNLNFPVTGKRKLGIDDKFKDWNRVVNAARDIIDPETGKMGYTFKTSGELEDFYLTHIKRMPTPEEEEAYFAFVRLNEMDRMLRVMSIVRNKTRVGAQSHQFYSKKPVDVTNKKGEVVYQKADKMGERKYTDPFDGVKLKHFPGGAEETVMEIDSRTGRVRFHNIGHIPQADLDRMSLGVASGKLHAVEVYDPDRGSFLNFSDDVSPEHRIRYVVGENIKTKPLDWNDQVPRTGGGHFDHEYTHYIKQAKMVFDPTTKRHIYLGDTTAFAVPLESLGNKFAKELNVLHTLISQDRIADAKAYMQSSSLPLDWKDFYSKFSPTRGPDGVLHPALFSKDIRTPFHVVERGSTIHKLGKQALQDKFPTTFRDGTKSGSLARTAQVGYTEERDVHQLMAVRDVGSAKNPVFNLEPAKLVDPIPTMNRALNNVINSVWMDDYKTFGVEHFLQKAAPHIDAEWSEIRHAPYYYFEDGKFYKPKSQVAHQLETERLHIKQLLGQPSYFDIKAQEITAKLLNTGYEKFGGKKTNWIEPLWLIPKVKNPSTVLRSYVYHYVIGMFAPAQLAVQLQTLTNVFAIRPKYAASSTHAVMLHGWSKFSRDPAVLKELDKYASNVHIPGMAAWKPGEWLEAHYGLLNSGFDKVGPEYSLQDASMTHKMIRSTGGKIAKKGLFFFEAGENTVRISAWYTSYKQYRDEVKPTGKLTNYDQQAILNNADDMIGNMSRASNNLQQQGILAMFWQFQNFGVRIAEQMWSKRLDGKQKARMLVLFLAMFGYPSAVGLTGIPFGEFMRKAAINHGYVTGSEPLSTLIMEGIPASIIGYWTGVFPNYGERYGVGGFQPIADVIKMDKSVLEIVGGAGATKVKNQIEDFTPMWQAMNSFIRNDGKFPATADDLVEITKEVSSLSVAFRTLVAINTGNWVNRHESILKQNTTATEAILFGLTGLQDQRVSDMYKLSLLEKDQKALEKYAEQRFTEEMNRAAASNAKDDSQQAGRYMARAKAWLIAANYPENKIPVIWSRWANQVDKDQLSRMTWDFYVNPKTIPAGQEADRMNTYMRIQELLKGKK